jgi:hypothetical protein
MDNNDNNNVYAPPQARVVDPQPKASSRRPHQVTVAIWLLWGSSLISFMGRRLFFAFSDGSTAQQITILFIAGLGGLFICALISIGLMKGKNWVRILFLAVAILGAFRLLRLISIGNNLEQMFHRSLTLMLISVVQYLLLASTFVLLFTKPGSNWFRKRAE